MWFTVKDKVGNHKGSTLISWVSNMTQVSATFGTSALYTGNYALYASREHFGDPSTYIAGTWEP